MSDVFAVIALGKLHPHGKDSTSMTKQTRWMLMVACGASAMIPINVGYAS